MFRSRSISPAVWLIDWITLILFLGLVVAAIWEYRSGYLPVLGSGLTYFCLAVFLPYSFVRPQNRQGNRILLATAYLTLIVSFLDFLAGGGSYQAESFRALVFQVVLLSLLYAAVQVIVVVLAIFDEGFHFPVPRRAKGLFTAAVLAIGVAWLFAEGLVGGCLTQGDVMRASSRVHWNIYELAMLFAALFSGMMAYILTRKLGVPKRHRARALMILCGLLIFSGLNEYFVRGYWLLFALSSVALSGAFFGSWEALAFVRESSEPGTGGGADIAF